MKTVQLLGKVYNLPESWEEVTVKQFMELRRVKPEDFISALSVLLQAPYDDVYVSKPEQIQKLIMPHLKWYFDEKFSLIDLPMPKRLSIYSSDDPGNCRQQIKIPTIELESFGKKLEFEKAMQTVGDPLDMLPHLLGIYFYTPVTKKVYDAQNINDFVENVINYCRIVEAYPIMSFFLNKLMRYLKKKGKFLQFNTPMMN